MCVLDFLHTQFVYYLHVYIQFKEKINKSERCMSANCLVVMVRFLLNLIFYKRENYKDKIEILRYDKALKWLLTLYNSLDKHRGSIQRIPFLANDFVTC